MPYVPYGRPEDRPSFDEKCPVSSMRMSMTMTASLRPPADADVVEQTEEHSHEQFLTGVGAALDLNNVDQVQDPVFALLGNAAAAAGAGNVEDLDCLQQRVADQAFTNAKAAGDVEGMTNALIFRALVCNTIRQHEHASEGKLT